MATMAELKSAYGKLMDLVADLNLMGDAYMASELGRYVSSYLNAYLAAKAAAVKK